MPKIILDVHLGIIWESVQKNPQVILEQIIDIIRNFTFNQKS